MVAKKKVPYGSETGGEIDPPLKHRLHYQTTIKLLSEALEAFLQVKLLEVFSL